MKHLLNNLSEEEKNSIREQHKGGMKVMNENFHKMVSKKLGHVELISEQPVDKDDPNDEYEWGSNPPGGHEYQENNLSYHDWFNKYEPVGGSSLQLINMHKDYISGKAKSPNDLHDFGRCFRESNHKMPESCKKFSKDMNIQNGARCIADISAEVVSTETVDLIKCVAKYVKDFDMV